MDGGEGRREEEGEVSAHLLRELAILASVLNSTNLIESSCQHHGGQGRGQRDEGQRERWRGGEGEGGRGRGEG